MPRLRRMYWGNTGTSRPAAKSAVLSIGVNAMPRPAIADLDRLRGICHHAAGDGHLLLGAVGTLKAPGRIVPGLWHKQTVMTGRSCNVAGVPRAAR